MKITTLLNSTNKNILAICGLILLQMVSAANSFANTSEVTLAWNKNLEPNVIGYQLHYGNSSGRYDKTLDVGDTTTVTVSNLAVGTTFYFVVTAYNDAGLESPLSNETSFTSAAIAPTKIEIVNPVNGAEFISPATILLNAESNDASIAAINFYMGDAKIAEDNSSPFSATWTALVPGDYTFTARATDTAGTLISSAPVRIRVSRQATSLGSFQRLSNGSFEFSVTGEPNRTNYIWASSDLKNWKLIESISNVTGTFVITDPDAAGADRRFYKVTTE